MGKEGICFGDLFDCFASKRVTKHNISYVSKIQNFKHMKIKSIISRLSALSLVILMISCNTQKQKTTQIILPEVWNFIPGDNPSYSSVTYDDSGWKQIKIDQTWDKQGYDKLDNYAWYRVKFNLPKAIKDNSVLKDSVRLYLGKIDDYDEVFLNGKLLGYNGITVPPGSPLPDSFNVEPSPWYKERNYVITSDDSRLLWDKENLLAVRVWDRGGLGGMYAGKPVIRMVDVGDYVEMGYANRSFVFKNGTAYSTFKVRNVSGFVDMMGTFSITATNDVTGKEIYNIKVSVDLPAGGEYETPVEIPRQEESTTLKYVFKPEGASSENIFYDVLPYILTPGQSPLPRINGAKIAGARPGRPFLFRIPVTGEKPLTIKVSNLPAGLTFDDKSRSIKGKVFKNGKYDVKIAAKNPKGETTETLTIVIGDQIALTPPMGWNSWNCWGLSVDQEKVFASAKVFVEKGLADHGWAFINIDDGWEIRGDSPEPKRNDDGTIRTNDKFPDMKALGDSIHSLGLKFGIYSSPGPLTCGGYTASYQHELQDAQSFARWGVDYLKYDWCSYGRIAKDNSLPELKKPYFVMREALNEVDRDIVYSLCQYGMGKVWEWGAEVGGNLWRTTGDITDTWGSMKSIGFSQVENASYAGPGHWNDPDMLVVGWVGWGPNLHPSRLTPNEQYTHITLWSLLSAPLLIGCDLERLDDFTLNLLTNDEVIAVNQDILGKQAVPVIIDGDVQVWVKELADGSKAAGIFNLGDQIVDYKLVFSKAGLPGKVKIRDLWRQKDIGEYENSFDVKLPVHMVSFLKISE